VNETLTADRLELLDQDMAAKQLMGFWHWNDPVQPYPITAVVPHLWRWNDVYQSLVRAGELVDLERAARRVALLVNPGLADRKCTTQTLHLSVQYLKPHEHARPHRHTMAALRFVVQGHGAYTTVNGQQCLMDEGDLILTPQLSWHDHVNESDQPIVWLDGLDLPLVLALQQFAQDGYTAERQPIQVTSDQAGRLFGPARPPAAPPAAFYHYKWRDTYPALQALTRLTSGPDRFDGYLLEFRHPTTGGPTLPSIQCAVQLLQPGQETAAHRHTSTAIYHVVRGSGSSVIGDQRFDWSQGDIFVVPVWYAHQHANTSASEAAILFSMTDAPLLQYLDLYREEAA